MLILFKLLCGCASSFCIHRKVLDENLFTDHHELFSIVEACKNNNNLDGNMQRNSNATSRLKSTPLFASIVYMVCVTIQLNYLSK